MRRDFTAEHPDELYVADITYVPTWAGFLFLAAVLDACTRRVVGWSMAHHLKTQLVLDALNMALHQRRPDSVIHHSDRGSQYTSLAFGHSSKSWREIAVNLYGAKRVAAEWNTDGWMRSRVRRRGKRARMLMEGGDRHRVAGR